MAEPSAANAKLRKLLEREGTGISWADLTFNPWIGCTRVSPACDNCYAETLATNRLGVQWGPHADRRRTAASTWAKPMRWNRIAAEAGVQLRVFCASLADVFDNKAPQEWREDLWRLIEVTPNLTWMLLTKRPQNAGKMIPGRWKPISGEGYVTPPPGPKNIWFGITAEDQGHLHQRGFLALRICAALGWTAFLSAEPLLGPLDPTAAEVPATIPGRVNLLTGNVAIAGHGETAHGHAYLVGLSDQPGFALVIAGGESGPNARPSHPDWFGAPTRTAIASRPCRRCWAAIRARLPTGPKNSACRGPM
jgi:protein gp37